MITILHTKDDLSKHLRALKNKDEIIGFVPTMGALHAGHLSLMEEAMSLSTTIIVSIFVNPTQFNNQADLDKYPRNIKGDTKIIEQRLGYKNIIIYAPTVADIYGNEVSAKKYTYDGLESVMEGANRPGHFDGVGTILEFLFKLIKPDVAVFGEKDFQQLQIVKKLVKKLKLPVKIKGASIHRESNMLAMSSRNERLSKPAREQAGFIYKSLELAKSHFKVHSVLQTERYIEKLYAAQKDITLEYFTIADEKTLKTVTRKSKDRTCRAFIVAHIEGVRLIDNMKLD